MQKINGEEKIKKKKKRKREKVLRVALATIVSRLRFS